MSRKIRAFSFSPHLNHKKHGAGYGGRKVVFSHLEYQLLAVNELQIVFILHVFYKHLTAGELGFSLSCSDKCFRLVVF